MHFAKQFLAIQRVHLLGRSKWLSATTLAYLALKVRSGKSTAQFQRWWEEYVRF
jgi:hypothetical protein